MQLNLKQNPENAQGVKGIIYLPNPNQLHRPLLGISRISTQWLCVFYLSAWGLLPDRYDVKKSKKQNKNAVSKLRQKFIATAKKSGVTIARNINVTSLLESIQSLGVVNLLESEKAEALLTALHYLYSGGAK